MGSPHALGGADVSPVVCVESTWLQDRFLPICWYNMARCLTRTPAGQTPQVDNQHSIESAFRKLSPELVAQLMAVVVQLTIGTTYDVTLLTGITRTDSASWKKDQLLYPSASVVVCTSLIWR